MLGLALALGMPCLVAADPVVVQQVEVDGAVIDLSDAHALSTLLVAGRLRVDFAGPVEDDMRLRYRLEGVDAAWRDLPNSMRILMNFVNASERRDIVGSCDFSMSGETPGWRQSVETSDFVQRKESTIAPAQTDSVIISILSHGQNDGVGVLGIDHMTFSVTSRQGMVRERVLDMTSGRDMDRRLGSPTYWYRGFGTRAEIAEVRTRPFPKPHSFLVLRDGDPQRYGNWSMNNLVLPVAEGEKVTLSWETAHAIGRSGHHSADYTGLRPGTYTFRAELFTVDGAPTGRGVSLRLDLVAPLYQRWYFWPAILVLAMALSAWGGHAFKRWRVLQRVAELERMQALERERERIARDLHDNIGAGLTEIAMLSDWVYGDLGGDERQATLERVDRIRQSAMELARSVDEIVWAINPANDNVQRFANYLMQASSQFLGATAIRVRYHIARDLPAEPISGKIRHNLFLVVREALNNTVKYSQAQLVRIELEVADHILRVVVHDDGIGFSMDAPGAAGTHEGLASMRRRMTDIGGVFHMTADPGCGTRIEVQVLLPSMLQGSR